MNLPFQITDTSQIIIFIGLQASGKTTFYESLLACRGLVHINLDTLHTRHQEAMAIRTCLDSKKSLVIDNTNPQIIDRQRYIPLVRAQGYEVIGIFFQSRVRDCINGTNNVIVEYHAMPYLALRANCKCPLMTKDLTNSTLRELLTRVSK